jgi:hypothetical protein
MPLSPDAQALLHVIEVLDEMNPRKYPFGHPLYKPPADAVLPYLPGSETVFAEVRFKNEEEAKEFFIIFHGLSHDAKQRTRWHLIENFGYREHWTLLQAMSFCREIEGTVQRCGYMLSVYGSVMRNGHGRDLDIILVPWRGGAYPEFVCDAIKEHLKASRMVEPENSLFADRCELLMLPDGRLLDIQVRMTRDRDALNFDYGRRLR